MGLGKSLSALALIAADIQSSQILDVNSEAPTLIITPMSGRLLHSAANALY